jgi:anti-sigma regulatory factor (Ser/Thr protein kinase)
VHERRPARLPRDDLEPGTFAVEARRPGDELEITVSDGGIGMARRDDSPGLGVGLPLITQLAGSLEVRSDARNGTTVVMRFARAE